MIVALVPPAQADDVPIPELTGNPNICIADAGSRGWCGDGGRAGAARLAGPRDVAALGDGGFLIADSLNHVVRRVSADGLMTTVAGIGSAGYAGDGDPATQATLGTPAGVAALRRGFVIADPEYHVVRRVDSRGRIETIAGTGSDGTSADGRPARMAALRAPRDVAALRDGSVLIADADDHRVRRVAPDGTISTFAGTGEPGTLGDGGPATAAQLDEPTQIAREAGGSVLIVDRRAGRVRRVDADGVIATVAGGEVIGTEATALRLTFPTGVTSTRDGGFLVTEAGLVRQVFADGTTRVAAGTGVVGFNGDRSLALANEIALPTAVTWLGQGNALVSDTSNDRVRRLNVLGGIRTVAGFDRPDQVLGPPVPPATSPATVARGGRARAAGACTARSRQGAYNVLRLKPRDPTTLTVRRGGKRLRLRLDTSLQARVTVELRRRGTVIRRGGPRIVEGNNRRIGLGAVPRRGTYRATIIGVTKVNGQRASRCDRRTLRVVR